MGKWGISDSVETVLYPMNIMGGTQQKKQQQRAEKQRIRILSITQLKWEYFKERCAKLTCLKMYSLLNCFTGTSPTSLCPGVLFMTY